MRRIVSFVLAMVMVMGMSMTAMAATITIENPVKGRTYNVYKIFDVTQNEDATSFAYTIKDDNEWYGKVSAMASKLNIQLEAIAGTADPVIYNVKRKDGFAETTFAKTFAEKLNTELQKNNFNPTATGTGPESGNLTITVTDPGYYFVDSSLGSLCFLNTTDATKAISEKNSLPSVGIKVEDEDKTEADKWSDTATADITEKVKFKVTANTGSNSKADPTATGVDKDYVITVTLPAGLTYETSTEYQLKVYTVTGGGTEDTWTLGTDYIVTAPTASTGLVITLEGNGKLKGLAQDTDVFVEYYATVNSNATIASGGNASTVKISYDGYEVPENIGDPSRITTVYTYQIDVLKYTTGTNDTEVALANAKFKLYKKEDSTKKYVQVTNEKLTGWTTTEANAQEFTTPETGKFSVAGLDQGTYYLVETAAPDGYNQLKDRIEVEITAQADNSATVTYKMPDDNNSATANTEIKVLNETGPILPSTGGMGTTLFYIVGGVMVTVAVVLLVTRKRMEEQE